MLNTPCSALDSSYAEISPEASFSKWNEKVDSDNEERENGYVSLDLALENKNRYRKDNDIGNFYKHCSAEQIGAHCKICGTLRMKKDKKKFFFEKDQYRSCWVGES